MPKKHEEEWNEYVLGLLTKDEIYNGNPTAHGLMRVCEMVYGKILECSTVVVKAPTNADKSTTVNVTLNCLEYPVSEEGEILYDKAPEDGIPITVCGAADSFKDNLVEPYDQHLVSSVETRALGRALRKLMCLKVVTAEETEHNKINVEQATDPQISVINNLCDKLKIDLERFLALVCQTDIDNMKTMSFPVAEKAIKYLNQYLNEKEDVPKEIKK